MFAWLTEFYFVSITCRQRSPSPTPGPAPPRPPKKAELAGKPLLPDPHTLPPGQADPTPKVMIQQDQVSIGGLQLPLSTVSVGMASPSPVVSIAMTSPPPQPSASSLEDQLKELQRTQQLQLQQLVSPSVDQEQLASPSEDQVPSQAGAISPSIPPAPANQDVITPRPVMNSEMLAPDANQALLDLQMLLQPPGEELASLSEPIQPTRLNQPDSQENSVVEPPLAPQRPVKPIHLQSQMIVSQSPPSHPSTQTEEAPPLLAESTVGDLQQLGGVPPQEATPTIPVSSTCLADTINVVSGNQVPLQGVIEGVKPPLEPQSQPYKPMIPFGGEEQHQTPLGQREDQQPLLDKGQLPPVQRDQPELLNFLADVNFIAQVPPSSQSTIHITPSRPPGAGDGNMAPSVIPQLGGGDVAPSVIPPSPPPPGVAGTDSTMTTNSISRPIPAPVQSPPPVQSILPTQAVDDRTQGPPPPTSAPDQVQPPVMAEQGDATLTASFTLPRHQQTVGLQSPTQQQQLTEVIQPSLEQEVPPLLPSTNPSEGKQEQLAGHYPMHKDETSVPPPPSEIAHLNDTTPTLSQSPVHPAASMAHPPCSLAELRTSSLQPSDFSLSHGIDTNLRDLSQPPIMASLAPLTSLHEPLSTGYTQEATGHIHDNSGSSVIAKLELLLEQQKDIVEKKTREVEERRAQIADQKRQLESYKQQVVLLQQQLSQLTAQQQKQEQEKVTVSGQQAVLMQLLQQQQGMFSQQQTQLESLNKVNEEHHKQLQETEMKYRQAITVEQEQKASLQNQVLQLNQEVQRLHGQLQSQSQQQQNTQMQVYQYHTQIQERDKQLLAFRDQHKEIVQKLEQKHQEKVQQLIQQIQELQMSLKKSREQQRALQGGLPMPIQPARMNQQQFQQPPQVQQQSVPLQQLPQQPAPPQPTSQMSQGPPPQGQTVPGTPTSMQHQHGILQPSQRMGPPVPSLANSTLQPLPPTSSAWSGNLGRQGSGIYHGQAQQHQIQPSQPMTPTSVATTGIIQPPRTQPGPLNTGTSQTY